MFISTAENWLCGTTRMTAPFRQARGQEQVPREPGGGGGGADGVQGCRIRGEESAAASAWWEKTKAAVRRAQPQWAPPGAAWLTWGLRSSAPTCSHAASGVLEAAPAFSGQPLNGRPLNSPRASSDSLAG